MQTNLDVIPQNEADLVPFNENMIAQLIQEADTLKWNKVILNKQINIILNPSERKNIIIGRFPDSMIVRFVNTGTAAANASVQSDKNSMSGSPVNIPVGTTDTTVLALGGAANWFLNIENTGITVPITVSLFLPRAGWLIAACSETLFQISRVNQLKQDLKAAVNEKNTIKNTNNAYMRTEIGALRTNTMMTPQMMVNMEIAPKHGSVSKDTPMPVFSKVPTGWNIVINRYKVFNGTNVYRTRPGGERMLIKTVFTHSWIDIDPMVDNTLYEFFFINSKGEEVGKQGSYTVKLNS